MVLDKRQAGSEPGSRREARRAEELTRRRADIVAAATEVFSAKGHQGAQMTEIAAAAEISLASLYASFSGKEELYAAAMRSVATEASRELGGRIAQISDPIERCLELIDGIFHVFETHRGLFHIFLSGAEGQPPNPAASGLSEDQRIAFRAWVTELARDALQSGGHSSLDPEVFAASLLGAVMHNASLALDAGASSLTDCVPALRAIFAQILRREDGEE